MDLSKIKTQQTKADSWVAEAMVDDIAITTAVYATECEALRVLAATLTDALATLLITAKDTSKKVRSESQSNFNDPLVREHYKQLNCTPGVDNRYR